MFIWRSLFWLTLAFIIIAPTVGRNARDVLGDTTTQITQESSSALNAGLDAHCKSLECRVARQIAQSALDAAQRPQQPQTAAPTQHIAQASNVPTTNGFFNPSLAPTEFALPTANFSNSGAQTQVLTPEYTVANTADFPPKRPSWAY